MFYTWGLYVNTFPSYCQTKHDFLDLQRQGLKDGEAKKAATGPACAAKKGADNMFYINWGLCGLYIPKLLPNEPNEKINASSPCGGRLESQKRACLAEWESQGTAALLFLDLQRQGLKGNESSDCKKGSG
jgi:hypothetical protein